MKVRFTVLHITPEAWAGAVNYGLLVMMVLSGMIVNVSAQGTTDSSTFDHNNPNHARLPCRLCHRREDNSARPTLPGKAGHTPCIGCHVQEFASPSNPICTVCHTNTQTGALKPFPPLRSFNSKFDHATHARVGASCANCHRPRPGGVALSIPARLTAHTQCFRCHRPGAESRGKEISSCGTCHELGRLVRTSERAPAFRIGFSHAKHGVRVNLGCADCHRVRAGLPRGRQVTATVPLHHHAPPRVQSCITCHDGKRAFGGDDFSACKRCHTGAQWRF